MFKDSVIHFSVHRGLSVPVAYVAFKVHNMLGDKIDTVRLKFSM